MSEEKPHRTIAEEIAENQRRHNEIKKKNLGLNK